MSTNPGSSWSAETGSRAGAEGGLDELVRRALAEDLGDGDWTTLWTVDGDLDIDGRLSHLEAHSTDGDLTIRVDPDSMMETGWSVRTTDGDISMTLPEGFGADLDVEADDGDIESDHPMMMEGKMSKNRFQGQLNSGGYPLRIRTSDGSVRLLKR